MDPTTTLITFLLETHPSVQSVLLVGSWDNFSTSYSMERDIRRGRGQWRGCHSFRDILNEDKSNAVGAARRNGGLRMGHTYYYYYEVDGSTETYDPAVPSTTACPYLPGQTVNTMNVPVEQALRHRSASLNSMRLFNFKTMNPETKFMTPRPAPAVPLLESEPTSSPPPKHARIGSAPSLLQRKSSCRSLSPAPVWKRLFGRKLSSHDGDRASSQDSDGQSVASSVAVDDSRSVTPSDGTRTRDISPESLRRFLSDDSPARPDSKLSERLALVIPEDIVEENEDDDNFATSAVSEIMPYPTNLSPPPMKHWQLTQTATSSIANSSALTLIPAPPPTAFEQDTADPTKPSMPVPPRLGISLEDTSAFPFPSTSASSQVSSPVSSQVSSPVSLSSRDEEFVSFYDSNDDDDMLSSTDGDALLDRPESAMPIQAHRFDGYRLPQHTDGAKTVLDSSPKFTNLNSPQLLARSDAGMAVSGANFLGTTIDTGLDDFASELGWMVDVIGSRPS